MAGEILAGTASWTDKSLIETKAFYPRGCNSAEGRLRYYASQFPCVEVDSSYYAMPSTTNAQLWAERTPDHFLFNVKAFRLFTGHQTPVTALPKDIQAAMATHFSKHRMLYYKDTPAEIRGVMWERFTRALTPLLAAGKLGAIHFQYPPWVGPNKEGYELLLECRDRLADYLLATEFRLGSWFDDEHKEATLKFEHDHHFVHVVLDMPQGFKNSVKRVWAVTNDKMSIVRFHGRNTETWNARDHKEASDRFNYAYTRDELAEFIDPIRKLANSTERVLAIMNVNFGTQGVDAARTLIDLFE